MSCRNAIVLLGAVLLSTPLFGAETIQRPQTPSLAPSCIPDATTLCLNNSRFKVTVAWTKPDSTSGSGQAISLTSDTGYFWFFSSNNVEMVIKVVDGRGLNSNFWLFAAGLTNVNVVITATDVLLGHVKTYTNPQGTAFQPIQDTSAFPDPPATTPPLGGLAGENEGAALTPAATTTCSANATTLCLNSGRFRVSVAWTTQDGATGSGQAVSMTADTGYFWFFSSSNVEMVLKVVDGRGVNQRYWVFAAGLTNVRAVITVNDTEAGTTKTYTNPQGTAFQPIQDTSAFAGTPVLIRSAVDRPDDVAGYQVKVLYLLPHDGVDRSLDSNGTLTTSFAAMQRWLSDQAGGRKFQADTFQGSLDIGFARLNENDSTVASQGVFARDTIEAELPSLGYGNTQKIYAVFYDGGNNAACAGGPLPPSLVGRAAVFYLRGTIPGAVPCAANPFAPSETSPGYIEFAMTHEIFHALGTAPSCAPHYVNPGHVGDDPRDLMYAGSLPWNPSILDVGRDDYWEQGGSCLDISKSIFFNPSKPGATKPPGW